MIDIRKLAGEASTIAISGHIRPDGDCIGSTLGLYNYLRKIYPEKDIRVYLINPNPVFSFLKGYDEIVTESAQNESPDLFLALDLSEKPRLGDNAVLFDNAK